MKNLNIGDVFPTNEGGSVTVINITGWDNITVKHNDSYAHTAIVRMSNLNYGRIKNPYHPNVFNMGYLGVGNYSPSVNGVRLIEYTVWMHVLERCYSSRYQTLRPSYVGCTVCEEWLNFQNFAHWYRNTGYYNIGYHIDKDILYTGNKVYSPSTCCMVPNAINSIFVDQSRENGLPTGVHKHLNRYVVKVGDVRIGSYDNIPEAEVNYIYNKQILILSLMEQYKNQVDVEVYYALQALAYTFHL